jgi:hypothetical protein
MPSWALILASTTLAFVISTGMVYSTYLLDAYFARRRRDRQEGIIEVSTPADPKFESSIPLPVNMCSRLTVV